MYFILVYVIPVLISLQSTVCGSVMKVNNQAFNDDGGDMQCPTKTLGDVFLPHPTDCNKYYICDHGVKRLQMCQNGLQFNPKLKACDYPANVKCRKDKGTLKPKGKISDEDFLLCPEQNLGRLVYRPHPTDCEKFLMCYNGESYLKSCREGLHFNPTLEICDYPENAKCSQNKVNEKPKGKITDEDLVICPKEYSATFALLPHPSECDKFFKCDRNKAHLQQCPAGLHFNPKAKVCDYPEKANCYKSTIHSPSAGQPSSLCPYVDSKDPEFFRHPSNCSIYYMCSSGLAYEFVCPAKLHFNLIKKLCDYEDEAKCNMDDL